MQPYILYVHVLTAPSPKYLKQLPASLVCTHLHTCTKPLNYTHTLLCIHAYAHTLMDTYMHKTNTQTCAQAPFTHTHTFTKQQAYTEAHVHMHMHAHARLYARMYSQNRKVPVQTCFMLCLTNKYTRSKAGNLTSGSHCSSASRSTSFM